MKHVSIAEFLHLSGISDSDLLSALESGKLKTASGPEGELRIDISQLTPEQLARRSSIRQSSLQASELALLEETVAAELLSCLEGIVDEALDLALSWYQKETE